MAHKDTFWMACDSTEQLRAEYGPFHTREEAEAEARKLGFGYLLRYEHLLGDDGEIEEVRCVFIELENVALGSIRHQTSIHRLIREAPERNRSDAVLFQELGEQAAGVSRQFRAGGWRQERPAAR